MSSKPSQCKFAYWVRPIDCDYFHQSFTTLNWSALRIVGLVLTLQPWKNNLITTETISFWTLKIRTNPRLTWKYSLISRLYQWKSHEKKWVAPSTSSRTKNQTDHFNCSKTFSFWPHMHLPEDFNENGEYPPGIFQVWRATLNSAFLACLNEMSTKASSLLLEQQQRCIKEVD